MDNPFFAFFEIVGGIYLCLLLLNDHFWYF